MMNESGVKQFEVNHHCTSWGDDFQISLFLSPKYSETNQTSNGLRQYNTISF